MFQSSVKAAGVVFGAKSPARAGLEGLPTETTRSASDRPISDTVLPSLKERTLKLCGAKVETIERADKWQTPRPPCFRLQKSRWMRVVKGGKPLTLRMTLKDLEEFVDREFVQVEGDFTVLDLTEDSIEVRLNVSDKHLRPGGTVSGPAMFSLADVTAYFMTLARIGPQALTVTTNCSIDFMRKPAAATNLIARGRLLKLGRQLSITDVLLFSEGAEAPVARASLTYSIPPSG